MAEEIGNPNRPPYRAILEAEQAGRTVEEMQTDIATALCSYYPDLDIAAVMATLQKVRPQKVIREGARMRPVQEIYGVLSIALKMRAESDDAEWPTREALAQRIQLQYPELNTILQRMPDGIAKRFVQPIPPGKSATKVVRVKRP